MKFSSLNLYNISLFVVAFIACSGCSRYTRDIDCAKLIDSEYVIRDSKMKYPQCFYLGGDNNFSYFIEIVNVPNARSIFPTSSIMYNYYKVSSNNLSVSKIYFIEINSEQTKNRIAMIKIMEENNSGSFNEVDTHPIKSIIGD